MAAKKTQGRGAGRQAPVNPDPLGLLPASLRPEATREKDEAAKAAHAGIPEVELGGDELDKGIDQFWSDDEDDFMTAANPMVTAEERWRKQIGPDSDRMAVKFFAPTVAGIIGMEGYQRCLDKDGNPYTVGEMFMGYIPRRIAEKRQLKALNESEGAVRESEGRYEEQVDRLKSDAKGLGLQVIVPGEEVEANATSNERSFGQKRSAGFSVTRGQ